MKNKFFRRAAVLTAVLFSFTCMSATAYAQSMDRILKGKTSQSPLGGRQ